jgi:hypothetical protein
MARTDGQRQLVIETRGLPRPLRVRRLGLGIRDGVADGLLIEREAAERIGSAPGTECRAVRKARNQDAAILQMIGALLEVVPPQHVVDRLADTADELEFLAERVAVDDVFGGELGDSRESDGRRIREGIAIVPECVARERTCVQPLSAAVC